MESFQTILPVISPNNLRYHGVFQSCGIQCIFSIFWHTFLNFMTCIHDTNLPSFSPSYKNPVFLVPWNS